MCVSGSCSSRAASSIFMRFLGDGWTGYCGRVRVKEEEGEREVCDCVCVRLGGVASAEAWPVPKDPVATQQSR